MSDTMRAISQRAFGGPEVLELAELPRPRPGPGEVLLRVHAASVNPVDWKVRSGVAPLFGPPPFVPGFDLSGVVERVGQGVDRFRPGDEAYGMPGRGAQAEYAAVRASDLAGKPRGIDHEHAAALASVGLTAWQALVDVAAVGTGQRVLIHAAAGGVGHVAVQIAKALGATVIGTARADNHEFLRELGADELIDYRVRDFTTAARDIDVVFDLIGGDYGPRSLSVLRPGGLLVTAVLADAGTDAERARAAGTRFATVQVRPSGDDLEQLNRLVTGGRLRVHLDHVFPLADVAKAHELSESGRVRGKIALTVR
jgi:NADPH:quinone reductase-like Zn-dependent oxidoreductase